MAEHWGPTAPPPRQPWPAPPNPTPPPKQRQRFLVTKIAIGVAAGIALFIVGVIVLAAVLITGSSSGSSGGKQLAPAGTAAAAEVADPVPSTAPAYTPSKDDFELSIKTLSKHCFGEAGCNVTYRVELAYGGAPLNPDVTYEVTYRVTGDEDGPQINTLEVTGDQYSDNGEEIASTRSASVKLKAVVTQVEAQ